MQRILNSTALSTPPTAPSSGTPGHFTNGIVGSVVATDVDDWWLDQIQEELMAFLTAASITPVAGTNNQVLTAVLQLIQSKAGFSNKQYITASGTFTVPANITKMRVRLWGAGGGGGGAYGPSSGQLSCAGAGGQGGGYCETILTGLTPGASIAATIGTGGAGSVGGLTNTSGSNGTTTSFGSYLSCTGGAGGQTGYSTAQATSVGGSGAGVATGGSLNINGQSGVSSINGGTVLIVGGGGGSCPFGGNGGITEYLAGSPGILPGGGGSGSGNQNATTTGGNGANGLICVEY